MPLPIQQGAPSILMLRRAYEESGIARASIDERFGLTPEEFRVEGSLVVIGPIYGGGADAVADVIAALEQAGLRYFDDFFELSGNWPDWLRVLAAGG